LQQYTWTTYGAGSNHDSGWNNSHHQSEVCEERCCEKSKSESGGRAVETKAEYKQLILSECYSNDKTQEGRVVTQDAPLLSGTMDVPQFNREALIADSAFASRAVRCRTEDANRAV
jgi:hypothetical protein